MSKSTLLKTCFEVIHYSGASSILRPFFQGQGIIFCLHHVVPGGGLQRGFAPNSNLEVTPQFLGEAIQSVRERGYELISLTEAVGRITSGRKSSVPFAVFTLDDGYRNNLVHALPVFRRHTCPFTVFVSPHIVEGTCELWWRALEAIIAGASHLDLEIAGQHLSLDTVGDGQKMLAWKRLSPLVQNLPEYEQRDWIRKVSSLHGIDLAAMCRSEAMTWDDIRSLNADPLATIGAHTLGHYNVMRLPEADARREIVESGRIIAAEIGEPVLHFAYPYGNADAAGPRDFRICREAGYMSALTTRLGAVFAEHAAHTMSLPRVILSGKYQKVRYLDALMSGVPAAMKNRFRRVNVA